MGSDRFTPEQIAAKVAAVPSELQKLYALALKRKAFIRTWEDAVTECGARVSPFIELTELIELVEQLQSQLAATGMARLLAEESSHAEAERNDALESQLATARNRPVEGWIEEAATAVNELIGGDPGYTFPFAEVIASHAPDLEAIRQEARKSVLLEAEDVALGEKVELVGEGDKAYNNACDHIAYALKDLANASPAEPTTASGQGETK